MSTTKKRSEIFRNENREEKRKKTTDSGKKGKGKRRDAKELHGCTFCAQVWKEHQCRQAGRKGDENTRMQTHTDACKHTHAVLVLMWNLSARRRRVAGSGTETTARTRRTVRSAKTAVKAAKDAHALASAKMSG